MSARQVRIFLLARALSEFWSNSVRTFEVYLSRRWIVWICEYRILECWNFKVPAFLILTRIGASNSLTFHVWLLSRLFSVSKVDLGWISLKNYSICDEHRASVWLSQHDHFWGFDFSRIYMAELRCTWNNHDIIDNMRSLYEWEYFWRALRWARAMWEFSRWRALGVFL